VSRRRPTVTRVANGSPRACASCGLPIIGGSKYAYDVDAGAAYHPEHGPDPSPFLDGSPSLGDFVNPDRSGIVLDDAVARQAPCIGYELRGRGAGPDLVFAKGIEGPLSDGQVEQFCGSDIRIRDVTPEQLERLSAFRESAALCSTEVDEAYPRGDRLAPYLSCMATELQRRGQPF